MKTKKKIMCGFLAIMLLAVVFPVYSRDIFVVGSDSNWRPVLWVNGGAAQRLSNEPSGVRSVFVSGNTVFAAGYMGPPNERATLWVNGVPQALSNQDSAAHSVHVSGNDVFVAGVVGQGNNRRATLWVNGVPQTLSNVPSNANSVFVSGRDVYVAGEVGQGLQSNAVLWVNGAPQILSIGQSIIGSGTASDVHVAGGVHGFWTNGAHQGLGGMNSSRGVMVFGQDVYILGSHLEAGVWRPAIFRNGVLYTVIDGMRSASAFFIR